MSVHITVEVEIPAPPDQVWAAVEDLSTHTEWMADAERITFVTDQRAGVGTELDCLTVVGPLRTTDRIRVTEWEPGAVMGIEHRGAVTGRGRLTLDASPGGTTFRWSEALTFPWWLGGALGEIAGKPVLIRVWRRNLTRLAASVAPTVAGPPPTPAVVDRSVDLDATADAVWAAVRTPAAFRTVARGIVDLPTLAGRDDDWRAGETVRGPLRLFRAVPAGEYVIHVESVDDATRTMQTRERGGLVRRWDHTLSVTPLADGRSRYRDLVVIDAAALTPVVTALADAFYAVRQRRWRSLARRLPGPEPR